MAAEKWTGVPVKTRALVIDPGTMTVLWANEAVTEAPSQAAGTVLGAPAEQAIPLAGRLGIESVVEHVAATGEPFHVHADVIPTRRGSMVLAISVYRLPDGTVLVLAEDSWEHAARQNAGASGRAARSGH